MHQLAAVLTLMLVLLFSCSQSGDPASHFRDSVVAAIRDSFSRQYPDSAELATALWKNRIVIVSEPGDRNSGYQGYWICSLRAPLYANENAKSKPIDSLPLGTSLVLPDDFSGWPGVNTQSQFQYVQTPDSVRGYVRNGDLAAFAFTSPATGDRILIGSTYGTTNQCHAILCDKNFREVKDTLSLEWFGGEGGSHYHAGYLYNIALAGVEMAAVFDGSNAACPESHRVYLIGLVNGRLKKIFQYGYGGEGSSYYEKCLYLPLRFENGKVFLVKGGNIQSIFNTEETRLNIFDIPDSIRIPTAQLVVAEEEEAEFVQDEKGNHTYDQNGRLIKKVSLYQVNYYRWTGDSLHEVK